MIQLYLSMVESRGEKSLVQFLYDEYSQLMYHIALSVLHNREDAEDAVHEAFLRVIKKLDKFRKYSCRENVSYLVIIVRGISLNMLNKRSIYEEFDENEADDTDLENIVIGEIGCQQIKENIQHLSPALRDTAMLYFVHGWSTDEIAEYLGIGRSTVYSAVSRARKKLAEGLKNEHYEV